MKLINMIMDANNEAHLPLQAVIDAIGDSRCIEGRVLILQMIEELKLVNQQ
jgi:hypothetical protein